MYWLPAIFIATNLLLIYNLDKLIKYSNCEYLYKKYNDVDLKLYVEKGYKNFTVLYLFLAFFIIGEIVFYIVGLFHPIWLISAIVLIHDLVIFMYRKIKPQKIDVIVKRASLEDFQSSNNKFQRLLKLNALKTTKTNNWLLYIFPMIKIILLASIIVLHYNYNYFL